LVAIAVALVLMAAAFHAGWNVLFNAQRDPLVMARNASALSAMFWAPVAGIVWLLAGRPSFPPEAWVLALLSGALELLYFLLLAAAYRRGPLSSVYSIARGTAPLLAVLAGVLVLGERLNTAQVVGIVALLAGLWIVRRPRAAGPATIPALLTGVMIAAYSAVDSKGVHVAAPWLYGFVVWAFTAALLWLALPLAHRFVIPANEALTTERAGQVSRAASDPPDSRSRGPTLLETAAVGLLMTSTYLIVLVALRLAPLAVVSPLRESAIVLVAAWGVWRLDERDHAWLRLAGAAAVAAGAAIIALE
jgi:drug/metabolite transporter (DMT)-like permease